MLVEGLFDKTASDTEVKRPLNETLSKVIKTGKIPGQQEQTSPLSQLLLQPCLRWPRSQTEQVSPVS